MASAGSHLHALRERHGVSLEELAQSTRISQRFLEALEADEFAALPAGPFAKGFIRSYCQALNEPDEEALALYAAAAARSAPRREPRPMPSRPRRSLAPVLVSLALLVILGAALTAVTVALRSGRDAAVSPPADIQTRDGERVRPESPPLPLPPGASSRANPAEPPARTAPGTPAPPAGAAPESPPRPPLPQEAERRMPSTKSVVAPYRLVARATDATWVRVRMDGGRTTEETIPAGETREWISNNPFELRVGNAGGISLELNGQALPPLGARGAVIMHVVIPSQAP